MTKLAGVIVSLVALVFITPATAQSEYVNDYPTVVRADYVFGCMASNGQTRAVLEKCACSIDVIATIVPYDTYIEAETILSMRQQAGERMSIFRTSPEFQGIVSTLRRAQAEAEIRCF